jgi:hypothetical protein
MTVFQKPGGYFLARIVKVLPGFTLSVLVCTFFIGCGSGSSQTSEQTTSSNSGEYAETTDNDSQAASHDEQTDATEAARAAVDGTFSDYLEQIGENSIFTSDYNVSVNAAEVSLEVTANFPIPVPKGAWDQAISEGIDPLAKYNEQFGGFKDMLQEQMQGFLEYLNQNGSLAEDWSEQFSVVLTVYNREGELLSEYK